MLLYPFLPVGTWQMNINGLETTIMRHIYANMTYPYTDMNINFYANERDFNAVDIIE